VSCLDNHSAKRGLRARRRSREIFRRSYPKHISTSRPRSFWSEETFGANAFSLVRRRAATLMFCSTALYVVAVRSPRRRYIMDQQGSARRSRRVARALWPSRRRRRRAPHPDHVGFTSAPIRFSGRPTRKNVFISDIDRRAAAAAAATAGDS